MKKTLIAFVFVFLAIGVKAENKISKTDSGVFHSHIRGNADFLAPVYIADPRTQLCFAAYSYSGGPALTAIPCENLAKDSKWATVITWVK